MQANYKAWHVDEQVMYHDPIINGMNGLVVRVYNNVIVGHYAADEVIPLQYTGLKDKNSKAIYEGDILKQTYHAQTGYVHDGTDMTFDGHHVGEVVVTARKGVCLRNPLRWEMETDETTVSNQYKNVAGYRSEIIGNIYENPELLEVHNG